MPKKEKILELYKIIMRDKDTNAIVQSRIYESEDSFQRQVKNMHPVKKQCYDIKYYLLVVTYGNGIRWAEITV